MVILLPIVLKKIVLIARKNVILSKNVVSAPRIIRPKHFILLFLQQRLLVAHGSSSSATSDIAPSATVYCTPEMVQQMLISALSRMEFQGKNSTTLLYVDLRASNHMTNTPTTLSHVRPYASQSAIQTANGNSLPIATIGNASSTFTDVFPYSSAFHESYFCWSIS